LEKLLPQKAQFGIAAIIMWEALNLDEMDIEL
jgi:hypothetical protein